MTNLTECQACNHSLNIKCCDLAYGFESSMQTNMNTHTHTHLTQINRENEHGQITGFRPGSKDVFLENNRFYRA